MKNYERYWAVEGTSVLHCQAPSPEDKVHIISFSEALATTSRIPPSASSRDSLALRIAAHSYVVRVLKRGTLAGMAYHRMGFVQAAFIAVAFAIISFTSIFINL